MTAHPHPLTNAQRQALHRAKVKAKLARLERYEAALREIAKDLKWNEQGNYTEAWLIANRALNAEAEA